MDLLAERHRCVWDATEGSGRFIDKLADDNLREVSNSRREIAKYLLQKLQPCISYSRIGSHHHHLLEESIKYGRNVAIASNASMYCFLFRQASSPYRQHSHFDFQILTVLSLYLHLHQWKDQSSPQQSGLVRQYFSAFESSANSQKVTSLPRKTTESASARATASATSP